MRLDRGIGKTARAVELWNQGLNIAQIGIRIGRSSKVVNTLLSAAGVKRSQSNPRKDYSPNPGIGRTFTKKFRAGAE